MTPKNPHRPPFITKKLVRDWQPYVNKTIRQLISRGKTQEFAVERALDLRDSHIKEGDTPPRKGR